MCFILDLVQLFSRVKIEKFVSLSTVEAKYIAVNAGTEAIWISTPMSELRFPHINSTTVYCYNQSAIQVAHNPVTQ